MLARRSFALGLGAATIATFSGAEVAGAHGRRPFDWPHGKRAAVSLSYDDGLDSQLDNAVPQLDAHGFKATFFLTKENMQARQADWVSLARRGYEIGDHTVTHPCPLKTYSVDRFEHEEVAPMEQYLNDTFGADPTRVYAYPCGVLGVGDGTQMDQQVRYIQMLKRNVYAARAADGDPNDPRAVFKERFLLQAIGPTYDRDDPQLAYDYLNRALHMGRWAIIFFHEVIEKRLGDGDTSIEHHGAILDWIASRSLWCAPMGAVLKQLRSQHA